MSNEPTKTSKEAVSPPRKPSPARRRRGRPQAGAASGDELSELIVAAAAQVYAQQGYHASSVEQIIQAAGTSRPTFYRYFKDRYAVIDVVVGRVNDRLTAYLADAIGSAADFPTLLECVVDAYFEWLQDIGPLGAPIANEIHDPASPASAHRERILQEIMELFLACPIDVSGVTTEPLLYEAAIHLVEHLGQNIFWPVPLTQAQRQQRRAIILQALHGMLQEPRPK